MNSNVGNEAPENSIEKLLLELINQIREIENFSGTLTDHSGKLGIVVEALEWEGVDFSRICTLQGGELLAQLEKDFEDSFPGVKRKLKKVTSIFSNNVQSTLDLSPEAQETQKRFDEWLEEHKDYAEEHQIKEKVEIRNDGIYLGRQVLKWDGLKEQPCTIEQIGSMIEALGGKELKFENEYELGESEISSFLSEVAKIEYGSYGLPDSQKIDKSISWAISVYPDGVKICKDHSDDTGPIKQGVN